MLLNRDKCFAFSVNPESETPLWQRLSAGLYQVQSSYSGDTLRFFVLGREEEPEQETRSSVKVYTFLIHRQGGNALQEQLLSLHGKRIGFACWDTEKNSENKGKICTASVEVKELGTGKAEELQSYSVKIICGPETDVCVKDLCFTI